VSSDASTVFQHHSAEPILGFRSEGTIVAWLPLFLFVVLFGLSTRSTTLDRTHRRRGHGGSRRHGRRVRTFGTLSSLELKQAGVGLAAAVLIDATVIRGVLLPASMTLLGDANWYLAPQLRWLPQLTVESTERRHLEPSLDSTN
jgi:uncharacterized membrane protein YdfJ with MMPL/SSD domain